MKTFTIYLPPHLTRLVISGILSIITLMIDSMAIEQMNNNVNTIMEAIDNHLCHGNTHIISAITNA